MDGVALLEAEVRELVRRRGIDPTRDQAGVRALTAEALADYERRSLTGALPALPEGALRSVYDAVAGFGPLQKYLDDPQVEEIWINGPTQVFVARDGRPELTTTILTDQSLSRLVEQMLTSSGRRLDLSSPFVDASLPGGERLHVVIPDVTRRFMAVNIRKFVVRAASLADLVAAGSLPPRAAGVLDACVRAGLNILVSGATHTGKTTMLNALSGSVPVAQRIVTAEEVFELNLPNRDVVAMQCRQPSLEGTGEISLRRLVKEALRMRPDRVVVGEVREAESLDLLIALNSGVPGMASIHANSARDAVAKICTLPLLAGENVSSHFVTPTVASAIDVVVHLAIDAHGQRRVREILAVTGRVEAGVVETAELFGWDGAMLVRRDGYPPHRERFEHVGIDLPSMLRAP